MNPQRQADETHSGSSPGEDFLALFNKPITQANPHSIEEALGFHTLILKGSLVSMQTHLTGIMAAKTIMAEGARRAVHNSGSVITVQLHIDGSPYTCSLSYDESHPNSLPMLKGQGGYKRHSLEVLFAKKVTRNHINRVTGVKTEEFKPLYEALGYETVDSLVSFFKRKSECLRKQVSRAAQKCKAYSELSCSVAATKRSLLFGEEDLGILTNVGVERKISEDAASKRQCLGATTDDMVACDEVSTVQDETAMKSALTGASAPVDEDARDVSKIVTPVVPEGAECLGSPVGKAVLADVVTCSTPSTSDESADLFAWTAAETLVEMKRVVIRGRVQNSNHGRPVEYCYRVDDPKYHKAVHSANAASFLAECTKDLGDVKALASMFDFMTPAERSLALKQSGYIAFPARFMEYLTAAGFTSSDFADFCLELSELAPDTSLFTSYQVEGETISIEPAGDQRRYVQLNESATVQELKEGNALDRATLTKFEEVLHAVDKTGGDVWSFMPFLQTLYEITSPSLILNANPRKGHTLVDGSWHVDGPPGENFYVAVIPTDTLHLDVVPGSHHIVGRYAEAIPKTIAASRAYLEKLMQEKDALKAYTSTPSEGNKFLYKAAEADASKAHEALQNAKEVEKVSRDFFPFTFGRLQSVRFTLNAGEAFMMHCNTFHRSVKARVDFNYHVIPAPRLHLVIQPKGSKPDFYADREPTAHPMECLVPCVSSHAFSSKILEPFRS